MAPTKADPFGTAGLRDAVVQAWRASPTRFTEDANAEEDLRLGGYADRLFVELAQNAADAATLAGVPGRLRVSLAGRELRVANTGAPLDAGGVAGLASLRASAKRGGVTVGRFGVGFAAVLAVSLEPSVVSRTGGVRFSASRTTQIAGELGELADQFARRAGAVPVLRLVWPTDEAEAPLPAGFDTEVRLPLGEKVDADALLAEIVAEVEDVLLTLPVLERIEVGTRTWTKAVPEDGVVRIERPDQDPRRWLVHSESGEFTPDEAATLGIEAAQHPRWTVLWALPTDEDGVPKPLGEDVLHAPTPTEERLSLPSRLIAAVPIEPSRRRVLSGPAETAVLKAAARAYPELVRRVDARHRLALVPAQGFPLSEVDGMLHELVSGELAEQAWIPAASGGDALTGRRARVLAVDSPALIDLLADVVGDLAAVGGPNAVRALGSVGSKAVSISDAVDELASLDRPMPSWRSLYDALAQLLDSRAISAEELDGLGVPLADGRTVPGARGVLVPAFGADDLLDLIARADIVGLRVAAPAVKHPLLERLGAAAVDAAELLESPELRAAVERSADDARSGLDLRPLADLVLRLTGETGSDLQRPLLGALALPAADGDVRRADELIHPSSPLLRVFAADAVGLHGPLAVLDAAVAERWPAETLIGVGVLDTFALVDDTDPVEPDHELPDEREWWSSHAEPPSRVSSVRDLDLVDDDAWPDALRLLAGRPETWRALSEPGGHAGWWIARFARLAGRPPMDWRLPDRDELAGLYEPVPDLGLRPGVLAAAGVRSELSVSDVEDAADLLERLADPERRPKPGLVLRAYQRLADAELDVAALDPPAAVRTLDGSVVDAARACVLDAPWLLDVADPALLVPGAGRAAELAELLDLPLASEVVDGSVASEGEFAAWSELGAVCVVADLLGVGIPDGGVEVHVKLDVRAGSLDHREGHLRDAERPEGAHHGTPPPRRGVPARGPPATVTCGTRTVPKVPFTARPARAGGSTRTASRTPRTARRALPGPSPTRPIAGSNGT